MYYGPDPVLSAGDTEGLKQAMSLTQWADIPNGERDNKYNQ